ncbi:MAG: gliding motility-associated C-terminal domain-containing protein, partial [Bacteroidota bacterium]
GSAGGTIVFDPLTGELMYTPLASEAGTTVTIDYTVCNTAVAPQVCSTETVTITVQSDSADSDGDGAPDNEDNCPNTSNSNQVDSDGDGIGDVCDDDRDGDGIVNDQDNCPDTPNADQADLDGDGLGDVCDDDTDGDGVSDNDEDLDGDGDPSNDDTDGDGTPDFEDTDDDGDGEDTAEEDTNGDGDRTNDDCNGDGIPDYLDADPCDGVVDPGEGFSPNGDGNNDGWVIENIENHPDNVVKVFNRWGNVVFETEDYDNQSNQWFGEVNGRLVLSDSEAPDGTYFYFIDLKDGNEPLSGYVIIKR